MNRLCIWGLLAAVVCFGQQANAQVSNLPSLADLVEQLQPSVVNISTTHQQNPDEAGDEMLGIASPNPKIQDYFNPQSSGQVSLGSGFIIDTDGLIITNNHVIDGASEVMVTLADNTQLKAEVVGKDQKTDIALIKIKTNQRLPAAKLGDSDAIRVGDWIVAIGNPFGLGGSVTAGIVSAKSRDIEAGPYDNFIQTDASINQGSSGGPMFNLAGEVIGINTAIFSTTGGNMGIGFAVPINLTKFVIEELKQKGKVERGWIGIKIQPNSNDIATSMQQSGRQGVVVSSVETVSPAQQAGIEAGDIIVSLNNEPIDDTKNFSRMIAETTPGQGIKLQLWRNKQILNVSLKVQLMAEEKKIEKKAAVAVAEKAEADWQLIDELGIALADITPDTADQYHLSPESRGMVITKVQIGSDAEAKGLKAGTLVSSIDKKSIFDLNDVRTYVTEARQENNRPVLLMVYNQQIPHYVAIKLKNHE